MFKSFNIGSNIFIKNLKSSATASLLSVEANNHFPCDPEKLFSSVNVECRSHDPLILKSYNNFVTAAAGNLGIDCGSCWALQKAKHDRLTLLKSVHIYKRHRVQYETRTHFRFMQFFKMTGSTLDTFLEYIERNLPEGVALKISKIELKDVPIYLKTTPL